jgi:hypothetical protein
MACSFPQVARGQLSQHEIVGLLSGFRAVMSQVSNNGNSVAPSTYPKIVSPTQTIIQDFESGNCFSGWELTGNIRFDGSLASRYKSQIKGIDGEFFGLTASPNNRATGTATSPEFEIDKDFINLKSGADTRLKRHV